MNEREFYRVILGLQEPWEVKEVKVDAGEQKVEVRVGYREGTLWACPESRERLPVHEHVERSWRHLDTCQFETVLVCRVPRLRLGDGKVWTVPVPWLICAIFYSGFYFTYPKDAEKLRTLMAERAVEISN